MAAFEPDAYLSGGTATDTFDPDAYLASDTLPEVTATQPEGDGFLAKVNAALKAPSPEWIRPFEEWATKPLLHPMDREERTRTLGYDTGPLPEEYLPEGKAKEVVGGLREAAGGFAEGLSSPAMLALTALTGGSGAAGRIAGGAFATQMALQTPELWRQFNEAETLQDKTRIAATAVATIGGAALGVRHAIKGGIGIPSRTEPPLRTEPLVPEPPPTVSMGPGTIAGDVSAAIKNLPPEPTLAERIAQPAVQAPPAPEAAPTSAEATAGMPAIPPETPTSFLPRRPRLWEQARREVGAMTPEEKTALAYPTPPEGPVQSPESPPLASEAPGGVPVAEPAPVTPQLEIPEADRGYAGLEPRAFSEEPHVSAIANRFTAERAAAGELGEIAPGESINTMDLVHHGLKMSPEKVNESISRIMQGGDVPINDAAAIRGEEARLSQRSNELSRLARTSPEAQLAADNAFKDLTDFHNGPVAQAKRNWHHQGKLMQGEIPVDLSTLNGMREAWLKDTGKPPPAHVEPKLQQVADKLAKAIDEERAAARNGGEAIEKATRGRKMPTPEEVRNNIAERMKVEPCIV